MDLVKWNDAKMSIGIDFIDDEHKQLLKSSMIWLSQFTIIAKKKILLQLLTD